MPKTETRETDGPCARCRAMRSGCVDVAAGRYHLLLPGICEDRDACEAELLAALGVEPVGPSTRSIVSGALN